MAMRQDKAILILKEAGLTLLQAKVYFVLISNNNLSVKSIAKAANLDRANVYREIESLQKMSLIKKTISVPNTFEAIPLKEGTSILLDRKRKDYESLIGNTANLLENYEKMEKKKHKR